MSISIRIHFLSLLKFSLENLSLKDFLKEQINIQKKGHGP